MLKPWTGLALSTALVLGCSESVPTTLPLTTTEIYGQALFGWCLTHLRGNAIVESTLDPTQAPWELYTSESGTRLYTADSYERLAPSVHIAVVPEGDECNVLSGLGAEGIWLVKRDIENIQSMRVISEATEGREHRTLYQIADQPFEIEVRERRGRIEQNATALDSIVRRVVREDQEQADG